jgi:hypothetical protein
MEEIILILKRRDPQIVLTKEIDQHRPQCDFQWTLLSNRPIRVNTEDHHWDKSRGKQEEE